MFTLRCVKLPVVSDLPCFEFLRNIWLTCISFLYCGYAHFNFTLHFGAPDVAYLAWRFLAVLTTSTFTDARACNLVSSSQRRLCPFPLCKTTFAHIRILPTQTLQTCTLPPNPNLTLPSYSLSLNYV